MAANVKKTGTSAEKYIKPAYIVATLFDGSAGETELTPQGDAFILEDVVQDTTSCSQDDNETTTIECETSDTPILEIVKQGKFQFAAEVADTQKELLVGLGGFKTVGEGDNEKVIAPSAYRNRYAKVDVVFEDAQGNLSAFIVPKLQLNSKILFESLNSNIARISLAGTAQNVHIDNGKTGKDKVEYQTSFYKVKKYTLPTSTTESGS